MNETVIKILRIIIEVAECAAKKSTTQTDDMIVAALRTLLDLLVPPEAPASGEVQGVAAPAVDQELQASITGAVAKLKDCC